LPSMPPARPSTEPPASPAPASFRPAGPASLPPSPAKAPSLAPEDFGEAPEEELDEELSVPLPPPKSLPALEGPATLPPGPASAPPSLRPAALLESVKPVAPSAASESLSAGDDFFTAPSARIEPQAPAVAAPVMRAVSQARIETPKTFGELLEQTLSLRPRD